MFSDSLKPAYWLTIFIAGIATVACAGGIFSKDLYQDSEFIKTAWFGNDIITLSIAIPLLLVALAFARKGSQRAQLVWMGLLGYMVYNYAFYLFGAVFNAFFLLYILLFSMSVYALAIGLFNLDVAGISQRFSSKTPVKALGIYLLLVSLPLGIFELSQCMRSIISGETPQIPSLIFALDLSVVVPTTALAAILLWRHQAWGYILGAMMLIKAFTYGMVLSFSTALLAGFRLSGTWDPLMPFYVFVALGGLAGSYVLLSHLKPVSHT